jgi:hypothetical protein
MGELTDHDATILIAVIIVVTILVLLIPYQVRPSGFRTPLNRKTSSFKPQKKRKIREGYGGPPGMARALSHNELPYLYGDRGWANIDRAYEGNTASSMSQFQERSA